MTKLKPKQKIIFIGTSSFALPALENLIENDYEILAVVTASDKPSGRKQEMTSSPVKEIALKYNLNIIELEEIKKLESDLIITASYGKIIPKEILDIPKNGSINLHPSLLPKYRGPSPIQTAILNGDKITGISIIKMDSKIDHGPIIAQQKSEINPDDTYQILEQRLSEQSADLLIKILPKYFKNKINLEIQDEQKASYTKILFRDDGKIDLKQDPFEIERKVRAFYPWPGTWTEFNNLRVKILKVKVKDSKLILELVQPAGKKPMSGEEFSRGHKLKFS